MLCSVIHDSDELAGKQASHDFLYRVTPIFSDNPDVVFASVFWLRYHLVALSICGLPQYLSRHCNAANISVGDNFACSQRVVIPPWLHTRVPSLVGRQEIILP